MRFHKLEESIISGVAATGMGAKEQHQRNSEVLLSKFRKSQRFYCGEIQNFPDFRDEWAINYPRLPFHAVVFEYSAFEKGRENTFFCMLDEMLDDGVLVTNGVFFRSYIQYVDEWLFVGAARYRHNGIGEASVWVASDIVPELVSEGMEIVGKHFQGMARILNVLNCVNVKTETIEAPSALNKKRIRNGKIPLYSYKTLVLKSSATRGADKGGTHESPRIHLRRGHIKHRKTGDFWWQPCVVGDRKRGVVMKDYRADELVH